MKANEVFLVAKVNNDGSINLINDTEFPTYQEAQAWIENNAPQGTYQVQNWFVKG